MSYPALQDSGRNEPVGQTLLQPRRTHVEQGIFLSHLNRNLGLLCEREVLRHVEAPDTPPAFRTGNDSCDTFEIELSFAGL